MISAKTKYSLKILLHIAEDSVCGRLSQGKQIAFKQNINEPYLEQIMISLKKSGLVNTVRGRNGGYNLGRDVKDITVLDIINVFETNIDLQQVYQVKSYGNTRSVNLTDQVWMDLFDAFCKRASQITLAMLLDKTDTSQPEYVI